MTSDYHFTCDITIERVTFLVSCSTLLHLHTRELTRQYIDSLRMICMLQEVEIANSNQARVAEVYLPKFPVKIARRS